MPVDSHIDICASLRWDLNTVREQCRLPNVAVPEQDSVVLSFALQNLNFITKRNSGAASKSMTLERVLVVEETAAASLSGLTLKKIGLVCKRDKAHTAEKRLNTDLMAVCKHDSGQATVQSKLYGALDAFPGLQARWGSACQLLSSAKPLSAIFCRLLNNVQCHMPSWRTRSLVQARLRLHFRILETRSWIEAHLPGMHVIFLMPRCRRIPRISSWAS